MKCAVLLFLLPFVALGNAFPKTPPPVTEKQDSTTRIFNRLTGGCGVYYPHSPNCRLGNVAKGTGTVEPQPGEGNPNRIPPPTSNPGIVPPTGGPAPQTTQTSLPGIDPSKNIEKSNAESSGQTAARELLVSGRDAATTEGETTKVQAHTLQHFADQDNILANSIGRDLKVVDTMIQPLLSSSSEEEQNRGKHLLAQSLSPPRYLKDVYSALNLETFADVKENGPRYVKNLRADADLNEKYSDDFLMRAALAFKAAGKMEAYKETVEERAQQMESLSKNGFAASRDLKTGTASPSLVGNSREMLESGIKTVLTDADLEKDGKGKKDKALDQNTDQPKGSKKHGSIADRLRAALAGKASNTSEANFGKNSIRQPASTSSFDGLFNGGSEAKEASREEASSQATGAEEIPGKVFHMSEADTALAVKGLIATLHTPGDEKSEMDTLGSPDVSIFARMKKYLTKAQADKRL